MECNNPEDKEFNETKTMDCAASGTKEALPKKCAKPKERRKPKAQQGGKKKRLTRRKTNRCKTTRRRAKRGLSKKKKRCFRPGPIMNNPYLNFLRFFRRKQCGISQQEVIRRGAIAWRRLPNEKRKRFQVQAFMNKMLNKKAGQKTKVCKKPGKKVTRKPKERKEPRKETIACIRPKKPKKPKNKKPKNPKKTMKGNQTSEGQSCASSSISGKRSGSKSCKPKKC